MDFNEKMKRIIDNFQREIDLIVAEMPHDAVEKITALSERQHIEVERLTNEELAKIEREKEQLMLQEREAYKEAGYSVAH